MFEIELIFFFLNNQLYFHIYHYEQIFLKCRDIRQRYFFFENLLHTNIIKFHWKDIFVVLYNQVDNLINIHYLLESKKKYFYT